MFLALDIGNTEAKAGLHDGATWVRTARAPIAEEDVAAWLRALAQGTRVEAAGLASVVPARTAAWTEAIREAYGVAAQAVHAGMPLPFRLAYETPDTLGADRLAAAAAAWHRFGQGERGQRRPVVALDAGTAVTLEVIDHEDNLPTYLGGIIAPGPRLLRDALASGTGQLPAIELGGYPPSIGRSTIDSIRSGVMLGFVDTITGLLRRIGENRGRLATIVITGGWSGWLVDCPDLYAEDVVYWSSEGPELYWEPHLVLDGVRLLVTGT